MLAVSKHTLGRDLTNPLWIFNLQHIVQFNTVQSFALIWRKSKSPAELHRLGEIQGSHVNVNRASVHCCTVAMTTGHFTATLHHGMLKLSWTDSVRQMDMLAGRYIKRKWNEMRGNEWEGQKISEDEDVCGKMKWTIFMCGRIKGAESSRTQKGRQAEGNWTLVRLSPRMAPGDWGKWLFSSWPFSALKPIYMTNNFTLKMPVSSLPLPHSFLTLCCRLSSFLSFPLRSDSLFLCRCLPFPRCPVHLSLL